MEGVIDTFKYEAEHKHIPSLLLVMTAYFTSYAEFIGGILLILGLFKNYALCVLGLDMVVVAIAFSYMRPMWDMKNVFPRLILICILLVMPSRWAHFGLDYIIRNF